MDLPRFYFKPGLTVSEDNILSTNTGLAWEVFSDRNDNPIYSDYQGSHVKGKVDFLESFFVINEVNGFLHVFIDSAPTNGYLSKKAKEVGWIRKSNLLLWKNCLFEPLRKTQLLITTTGYIDLFSSEPDVNSNGVVVYFDPELKTKSQFKTQQSHIYYVYKKEGEAFLIGIEKRITSGSLPKESVLGWVPVDFCFQLDSPIWVTPDNSSEARKEMREKGLFPMIFVDEKQAIQFMRTNKFENRYVLWHYNPDNDSSELSCFPLIKEYDNIFQVKLINENLLTAFAPSLSTGMVNPFFKKVVLISNFSLSSVITNMHILINAMENLDDREEIKKCFIKAIKGVIGNISDEYLYSLSLKEIINELFWVSTSENPIENYPLWKITDPSAVSEGMLKNFAGKLKSGEAELSRILNSNKSQHGYSFISNNTRYFWVDLSLFP